jgi:hypothetical protein
VSAMREVFELVNRLKAEGTLIDYAVGGASAIPFHAEPVNTYDLDLFVFLPSNSGIIISMAPLYARLRELGHEAHAEHLMIAGVPVQFLPAYNPLVEEAVRSAVVTTYDKVPVRVVGSEHLAAIALQTGGAQRTARIDVLRKTTSFDEPEFIGILIRHGLEDAWKKHQAMTSG